MKPARIVLFCLIPVLSLAQSTLSSDSLYLEAISLIETDYDASYVKFKQSFKSNEHSLEKYHSFIEELIKKSSNEQAIEVANEALRVAPTQDNISVYAEILDNKAEAQYRLSREYKALATTVFMKELGLKYQNPLLLIKSNTIKASVLDDKGDLVGALEEYLEALNYAIAFEDESWIAFAYGEIAIVYESMDKLDLAIDYNKKALKVFNRLNKKGHIAKTSNNLGMIYDRLNDFDSARYFLDMAYHLADSMNLNYGKYVVLQNIALNEFEKDNFKKAIDIWETTLAYFSEQGVKVSMAMAHYNIARAKKALGEENLAFSHAHKGLNIATEGELIDEIASISKFLSEIYNEVGDFEKAYEYQSEFIIANDSLFNRDKNYEIGKLESKNEIARQKYAIDIKDAKIREQDIRQTALFGGISFLVIVLLLIYRSQRIKTKTNRQLTETEALKNRWIVNISHELKTPLTLVQGPINKILKNDKLNPVDKQDLIIAGKSTKHLNKLVMEMLDLSKVDKGRLELKRETVDFGAIVRTTAAAFDSMAINNGIKLAIETQASIWMDLDSSRIRKVVENLITNAFKFTQEDGTITIALNEEEEYIVLRVSDSGEGISEEDLPHIFERYFQSKNPAKSRAGGTGVGLSLSNEIVKLHEGVIAVHSKEGEGSRFEVKLPKDLLIGQPDVLLEEEPPLVEEVQDQPSYTQINKGVPRILLVEDNYEMRQFIQSILKEHFSITLAKDGLEAIQKLVGTTYDLIISDIMMPRMDGKQLIEKVKASDDTKDIPFVILTALNDNEDKLDVLRTGVDDYLPKPFDAEELKLRIANLIANRNSRAEETGGDDADDLLMVSIENDIRNHMDDPQYAVSMMAENANMSVRSLHRVIKQKTGLTPLGLVNELKLQYAMRLLEIGEVRTLKEVCAAIGFERTDRFSTAFKKRFGKRPAEYL